MIDLHFDCLDSTHTYAKSHSREFAPHQITCITAEEQTAGYGRFQRPWLSPSGLNLYVTFYFQLPAKTLHLISLSQVMAHSFATILLEEGLHPKIKWPNDLQLNGKKVSGILCETRFEEATAEIFLSIGINVNMEAQELAQIGQPVTSLKLETHRNWDRLALLKKLQRQFLSDLDRFKKAGFAPFHNAVENLLAHRGETIRCFDGKNEWTGVCHSLTYDGQLNLLLPNQLIQVVSAGELV